MLLPASLLFLLFFLLILLLWWCCQIGILAIVGTSCFFLRAVIVLIINGGLFFQFQVFEAISLSANFDYFLLGFWLTLEWFPSLIILLSLNGMNKYRPSSSSAEYSRRIPEPDLDSASSFSDDEISPRFIAKSNDVQSNQETPSLKIPNSQIPLHFVYNASSPL